MPIRLLGVFPDLRILFCPKWGTYVKKRKKGDVSLLVPAFVIKSKFRASDEYLPMAEVGHVHNSCEVVIV